MPVVLKWESIGNGVQRAKVIGGWLVTYDSGEGGGITFVPDPDYSWFGEEHEEYFKEEEIEEVEENIIETFHALEYELDSDANYTRRYYPKGEEQLRQAQGIILESELKAILKDDEKILRLLDKALKNLLKKGEIVKVDEIDNFPEKGKIKILNGYKLKDND